jgi:hypothetical protein
MFHKTDNLLWVRTEDFRRSSYLSIAVETATFPGNIGLQVNAKICIFEAICFIAREPALSHPLLKLSKALVISAFPSNHTKFEAFKNRNSRVRHDTPRNRESS